MLGRATDLECLESSASSGTTASPAPLQSAEVSSFLQKASFKHSRVCTRADLRSVGGFAQLFQQVLDGPHYFQWLTSATVE